MVDSIQFSVSEGSGARQVYSEVQGRFFLLHQLKHSLSHTHLPTGRENLGRKIPQG